MSVFPAKILVATDGSEDAILAVQAAVDLSNEPALSFTSYTWESHYMSTPLRPRALPHRRRPGRRSTRWPGGCSKRKSNRSGRWGAR